MTIKRFSIAVLGAASLAACVADYPAPVPPPGATVGDPGGGAAGTRLAGQPHLEIYEGTVEQGTECRVLRTDAGERWSFNTDAAVSVGDRVSIRAELADASYCQEGEGTLIVESIAVIDRPAGN